jgi:hypothetical protein
VAKEEIGNGLALEIDRYEDKVRRQLAQPGLDARILPLLRRRVIELKHGDSWLVVAERPTVKAGTQDDILAAAERDGMLKLVFDESASNNDECADRPNLSKKGAPEEPAERRSAQDCAEGRPQQPAGCDILQDDGAVVHEVVGPVGGCKLSGLASFHGSSSKRDGRRCLTASS